MRLWLRQLHIVHVLFTGKFGHGRRFLLAASTSHTGCGSVVVVVVKFDSSHDKVFTKKKIQKILVFAMKRFIGLCFAFSLGCLSNCRTSLASRQRGERRLILNYVNSLTLLLVGL